MSTALVLTAALMGLAGTPHCAAMCGAGCAAAARMCMPVRPARAVVGLMLGRLLAYVAAGMVVASVVTGLRTLAIGAEWLRPIWLGLQVFLTMLGLWLLLRGRLPRSIEAWVEQIGRRPQDTDVVRKVHLPGELKATAVGLLWPVLPCVLLYAALLVAAVASGPLDGGLVMLAFGLTSMLGVVVGPWLWLRFIPAASRERLGGGGAGGTLALRLAGAMICGVAGWSLLHAVLDPGQAWCA